MGQRQYKLSDLEPETFHKVSFERKTIAYARVSSHDQKADLERQKRVLESYCGAQGWTFELVSDLDSGLKNNKRGVARVTYNWARACWKEQYSAGNTPNEAALRRELNAVKKVEFPWM